MPADEKATGILSPYRVLDLTTDGCMMCGKVLGDLGADVIQIEPPGGSPTRSIGPFYHDTADPERSLTWFYLGLNKRGITLDLESPDGREVFRSLVRTAHFVIESGRPGHMGSLGLGYEDLRAIRSDIIMTSITPFGQTGPYVHYQVTDIVGMALSGIMWLYGEPDRAPVRIPAPQFYMQGGLQGAMGTMVAHYHRELAGEGQYVDQSCQQAIILTLMNSPHVWDLNRFDIRGHGPGALLPRPTPPGPLFARAVYPCKDGYVVAWFGGGGQKGRVASSEALVAWANEDGQMLGLKDYDWASMGRQEIPQEEADCRSDILERFLLTKTKAECLERAIRDSILIMPINDIRDVVESPQLAFREFFQEIDHPELDETITYPGFPVHMGDTQPCIQCRAPLIGEHNQAVYGELGISDERLARLRSDGVI